MDARRVASKAVSNIKVPFERRRSVGPVKGSGHLKQRWPYQRKDRGGEPGAGRGKGRGLPSDSGESLLRRGRAPGQRPCRCRECLCNPWWPFGPAAVPAPSPPAGHNTNKTSASAGHNGAQMRAANQANVRIRPSLPAGHTPQIRFKRPRQRVAPETPKSHQPRGNREYAKHMTGRAAV